MYVIRRANGASKLSVAFELATAVTSGYLSTHSGLLSTLPMASSLSYRHSRVFPQPGASNAVEHETGKSEEERKSKENVTNSSRVYLCHFRAGLISFGRA